MDKGAKKRVKKEKGGKVNRSTNFSKEEERLLLQLVLKRKRVLISRASDQQTAIEKIKAWDGVAEEFDAACPNNIVRIFFYFFLAFLIFLHY